VKAVSRRLDSITWNPTGAQCRCFRLKHVDDDCSTNDVSWKSTMETVLGGQDIVMISTDNCKEVEYESQYFLCKLENILEQDDKKLMRLNPLSKP
jgi:hypothetical protein